MTYEEVKERIEYIIAFNVFTRADKNALKIAIESLEKQIPNEPRQYGKISSCPVCGIINLTGGKPSYCEHCGQALDWGDENA